MNIFEFALEKEQLSEQFYRELASVRRIRGLSVFLLCSPMRSTVTSRLLRK